MSNKVGVALRGVCKGYQEAGRLHQVLNNIDAGFKRGEFIVIQGRSGSGKSTLLNLLAGIDLPDDGDIHIHGQTINHLNEHERTMFRRHHIGFVFQSFNLIPTLSVAENLAFPLELNGITPEITGQRVAEHLRSFSLEDRMDSFPDQLSGGEQQRVAIARATVHTPDMVLADEPTGNLDLETEHQVLDLLKSLPHEHGVTVICATHSAEVALLADSIYQLEEGQLHG